MNILYQKNNQFILKINRGERVVASLIDFCRDRSITSGWIQGLGAVDHAEFSYYDLANKEYIKKVLSEECELLQMTGNIALVDEVPLVHAHITLARSDYSTLGGHLHEMHVSGTCEINLQTFEATFTREYDETTGLKLLTRK